MLAPACRVLAIGAGLLCWTPVTVAQNEPENSNTSTETAGVRLEGAARDGGRRIRLGGVSVGAGYSRGWPGYGFYGPRYWGPAWYGSVAYNPWAWGPNWGGYDPFWYSPLAVHPGYWMGFGPGEGMGEVKLETEVKTASVYIDGGYAGAVKDRRSMWLRPGTYELRVRDGGKKTYAQRIYVLSGKTLRVRPEFTTESEEVAR
jgi:hypothetical protein